MHQQSHENGTITSLSERVWIWGWHMFRVRNRRARYHVHVLRYNLKREEVREEDTERTWPKLTLLLQIKEEM